MKIKMTKGMAVGNCFWKNSRLVLTNHSFSKKTHRFSLIERILPWESGLLSPKWVVPLTSCGTLKRSLNLSGLQLSYL